MTKLLIDRALLEKALAALDAGLKLSPRSEFHDRLRAALEQREPLSADALARELVTSRIIDPAAIDDPVGYDGGMTLARVLDLHRRLAALEQEEQEPVAWYDGRIFYGSQAAASLNCADMAALMPLYTHPLRREWQGLSEGEIVECDQRSHGNTDWGKKRAFAHAIETALKERNHD